MSAAVLGGVRDGRGRIGLRWGLCFALVVALHAGAAWVAVHWRPEPGPAPTLPPAAVMIDLAPLPATSPATTSEAPPSPQDVPPPPPPLPEVEPEPPPPPEVRPEPPAPLPEVAIPLPPPPAPKPPVRHTPAERRTLTKPLPAPAITAPRQAAARPSPTRAAPSPAGSAAPTSNAVPTWQSLLLGRLERFKRYPREAQFRRQQGVAYLRFSMDRHGNVLATRIEKSSGVAALDAEALALVRRAAPLPPPPPEVAGDPIELTVPVAFSLRP